MASGTGHDITKGHYNLFINIFCLNFLSITVPVLSVI